MLKKSKNGLIIVMVLLLHAFVMSASIAGAVPIEEWRRTFGEAGSDFAASVVETTGGYALAGSSYSAGGDEAWLRKTDVNGIQLWKKAFGGASFDDVNSVQRTSDGGYILAGKTWSYGAGSADAWLVKTDVNGNEQWNRTFGGASSDSATSVLQASDGGYIFAGYTNSFGAGSSDGYLVKTDASGRMLWSMPVGGAGYDNLNSIQKTNDGGYILSGSTDSYEGIYINAWLIKIDANGNQQWSKTFPGIDGNTYARSVQQTTDGGYIFAGSIDMSLNARGMFDAWLVKTDASGNKLWDKKFGVSQHEDEFMSVQQTSEGGYILAGYTMSYGSGGQDAWLIKTDANGNQQWMKTFGGADSDESYSVRQISDGSYILAGRTYSFGAGNGDAWLIKVSDNDYAITANPSTISSGASQSATSKITIQSINNFRDTVDLTWSWVGATPSGVNVQVSPNQVTPPSGGSGFSTITTSTTASPSAGTFTLRITGVSRSGSITHSVDVPVIISLPDYTLTANPSSLLLSPSQSATSRTTIQSINNFMDTVDLTSSWVGATPSGVTVQLSPNQVTPPSGGSGISTLSVSTSASPSSGAFTLRITGVSRTGSIRHTVDVTITTTGAASPCGCTLTGNFNEPEVVPAKPSGDSPDGSSRVSTYSISGTPYLKLTRLSDNRAIVDTNNPLAYGFSPNSKYFVLATRPPGLNTNQLYLSVYDIDNAKVAIPSFLVTYSTAPGWTSSKMQTIGTAGWGFSQNGKAFLLAYKTGATTYNLNLYDSTTGSNKLSLSRSDVAAFWQFSPCGDLLMFVTQAGSNPSTADYVYFYYTSSGQIYKQLNLNPPSGSPSAKVAKVGNNFEIQLTGMSQTSMLSPQCSPVPTPSPGFEAAVAIVVLLIGYITKRLSRIT